MNFTYRILTISAALILGFIIGCSDTNNNEGPVDAVNLAKVNSCEGCHTNYDHLKDVYTPDPPSTGGGGCGGDAPHYEPYDRVYLGGDGYEIFKVSMHGRMGCVKCHNGVDGTDNKEVAHSGEFIKRPSKESRVKCAGCHEQIVQRTTNSLHEQGWGQKRMVVVRGGYGTVPTEFANLPQHLKEGYDANCGSCHGTCGDCHIVRPNAGGGGLANGHNFKKTPDMLNTCVTCHVSRGGHAYPGQAVGTKPDVHLIKAGFTCLNCHSKNEIHGTGEIKETRNDMPSLPKCEYCHPDIANSNTFHTKHLDTFNCYTCHSQDYNNCGSCHIHGEGARIPSHQKFKIGMNPIPELRPYKFATLRQSLMAPDSWKEYDVPVLSNFDAFPTYKYTTPHNIIRWTSHTEVGEGKACYDACHIIAEGDSLRNKELYLFESDLEEWEKSADQGIIVDGKLPANWGL
jgi:thiosulfate/3-mercaptopyruvate sulfurtransferase